MITVAGLIELLTEVNPDAPVHLAIQPSWPLEHALSHAAAESGGVVYLAEGHQIGYLPDAAKTALGDADPSTWA